MTSDSVSSQSKRTLDPRSEHVGAIAPIHAYAERDQNAHQRVIERITAELGRPGMIYLLFVVIVTFALGNLLLQSVGRTPLDAPPFPWLQGAVGLYAAVISTMV
jgi:uncharacterized membrane protein